MITREKLRIYENYRGDSDGWARASESDEQSIKDQDWALIGEILQSLRIVQSGLASARFETEVRTRALDSVEDEYVYERLFQLAKSKQ
jgi:hypothetical protein